MAQSVASTVESFSQSPNFLKPMHGVLMNNVLLTNVYASFSYKPIQYPV